MTACPPWTHQHMVQAGTVGEKQRWRCRGCGYQCTRATPRGRPMWQKSLAVLLSCHGVSMHALGRMFGVRVSAVLTWLRRYAAAHAVTPEPTGKTRVLERDEMWRSLKKTAETLDGEGSGS